MICEYDFVEGDNALLQVTCKNEAGTIIPLDNSTVKIEWLTGYPDYTLISRNMTITDAMNGEAEYRFLPNEMLPPEMTIDITITDGQGNNSTNTCPLILTGRSLES